MATPNVFEGFDVIEGFDPIDKAELVGKPFGITGIRFRANERSIVFAEAEIITADGEPMAFQDASTGVRDQLAKYLTDKGVPDFMAGGAWHDVKLYVPRGLRVSTYDAVDDRGQVKKAKTYYLTTAGRNKPPVASNARAAAHVVGAETQEPGNQSSKPSRRAHEMS